MITKDSASDIRAKWRRYWRGRWRGLPAAGILQAKRLYLALTDPFLGTDAHPGPQSAKRHSIRAGLLVAELTGEFRRHETPLLGSSASRLRGRTATAWGVLTLGEQELLWVPGPRARDCEARELIVRPLGEVTCVAERLGRKWSGVTLVMDDGAQVWLRIPTPYAGRLLKRCGNVHPAEEILAD